MKTIFKAAAIAALALGTSSLSTAALAQAAAPAPAASIIVVDMARVASDSAAGKSGQTQLKTKLDSLQARGKTLSDSLRTEEETLLKARQTNTMAPEAFQAKVKDLQTKQNNARTELGNREQELQRSNAFVNQQIFNAVGPIIQTVMRERGATVVLARDAALAVAPALDVTAEVIRRLDAALPRVNATAPAAAPAAKK
ncbi:MAG: OmpH family outer membrane protein [Sphingomonadaceae bacterium]|nr:OmpH family outer membrane protein [Sphingomonadaceae bacterium]